MKSQVRRLVTKVAILLFLSLLCLECDPGYRLQPVGWQVISDHEWSKHFGDFEIQTRGIGGLIGEWWVDPDLQIQNNTRAIGVKSAELLTAKGTFQAKIYGQSLIPPSTKGYHLPVSWEFDNKRPAPTVLGDHCQIVLILSVGAESRRINIEYAK